MTNKEIVEVRNILYEQIKDADERLKKLRDICKHEKTFVGNYSYRVGSIMEAEMCVYCEKVIRFIS